MSDEKFDSLKKRVADRIDSLTKSLDQNLSKHVSGDRLKALPPGLDQTSLQTESAILGEGAGNTHLMPSQLHGGDLMGATGSLLSLAGQWRCVVNSNIVAIDLIANVQANGTLFGQGTIVYIATNRIYKVKGPGDWTVLPPDQSSPDEMIKFRLQPSNHAIFSWFAKQTGAPNHLRNRFVVANNGGVVETACERIG